VEALLCDAPPPPVAMTKGVSPSDHQEAAKAAAAPPDCDAAPTRLPPPPPPATASVTKQPPGGARYAPGASAPLDACVSGTGGAAVRVTLGVCDDERVALRVAVTLGVRGGVGVTLGDSEGVAPCDSVAVGDADGSSQLLMTMLPLVPLSPTTTDCAGYVVAPVDVTRMAST
jgi:hypothetical protein